ncbi:DUF4231 domain-containing protein [Streptomyces fuscichromogenes]|uniref:Uncharacterized protein n=1 Tax=Streptomyces fuscichromogenes TaxID=1324013 RepID=A0A917XIC1_9ACTN|nr:DUF4231 domain-containing protein [Streptomyces fuscichromogenes]GGN26283.1 hypothetical protein GCM10011578_060770 [Streptomyces fuscichromogenes]
MGDRYGNFDPEQLPLPPENWDISENDKRPEGAYAGESPDLSGDAISDVARESLRYYGQVRDRYRRMHRISEVASIAAGAFTVVAAGLRAPAAITVVCAGVGVFIAGIRQVFDPLDEWARAVQAWTTLRSSLVRYEVARGTPGESRARRALLDTTLKVSEDDTDRWIAAKRRVAKELKTQNG